jgi:HAD superfamily hydrolase (TIGR01509 family)
MQKILKQRTKPSFINKTAVIFDFDGTIADTLPIHERAYQEALKKYKLSFRYTDYLGLSTFDAIRKFFISNNVNVPEEEIKELVKLKRKLANELYRNEIIFMPGAENFIHTLVKKNYQLFIASSGSKMNVTTGIQTLGIEKYFRAVITADDVTRAKPDPEIFEMVLNNYSIQPGSAIIIEDSVAGLQAANAAGIESVCVDATIQAGDAGKIIFYSCDFFELITMLEDKNDE